MSELQNEKPPIFKSWTTWYALVIGVMVFQVIIYLIVTRIFS